MTRPDDDTDSTCAGRPQAGPAADGWPAARAGPAAPPGRPSTSWRRRLGAAARTAHPAAVSSWLIPVAALVVGLVAGALMVPTAPGWLAPYLPVAVVAALDALAGGLRAALERVFDDVVFVVSFLTNAAVAMLLVGVGDRLGVGGALTTAVVVVFGIRIFTNATALRRHLFRF